MHRPAGKRSQSPSATSTRVWSAAVTLAIAALAMTFPAAISRAQQIALFVNGDPITTFDIEQRSKFTSITTHKTPPRHEVIDDLINDKLKIQIGKRYKLEVSDQEVDATFSDMGKRMQLTPPQLTQLLAKSGVDAYTLKDRIRADIAWQQIVRGKFQANLQVREKDIVDALDKKEDKDQLGVEYKLRPILFVVRHDAPEGTKETRKREAESLRSRFENCETGIPHARTLADVAVRPFIIKTSADLPAPLAQILDKTPVGHLTEPEVTAAGVQVFAVCSRKETKIDSAAKRSKEVQIYSEKFQSNASKFLKELRQAAMIEIKDPTVDVKTAGPNAR
jgi:peptidyl-prolyl cis-trans isomerase SurA